MRTKAQRKKNPKADKDVLLKSRRRCCLCFGLKGDHGEKKGQIAHLDHDPANDKPDNLAFLCLEHHDQYDSTTSQSKSLQIGEVKAYREQLYQFLESSNQDSQSAGRHVDWTTNVGDHIVSHRELAEGSYLESNNNRYKLVVQGDGNLVIYDGAFPVWATGTDGKGVPPFKLVMQGDGNLVMYDGNGKPTWDSKTNAKGRGPFRLTMQDDRNIVIYDSQGKSTWASNTSL